MTHLENDMDALPPDPAAIVFPVVNTQAAAIVVPTRTSSLATADQQTVESLALKLLMSSEMKVQKQASMQLLLANPAATTSSGKQTVQRALDELAYAAALGAANGNPANPRSIVSLVAPHAWLKHSVPGSRFAYDNPDNVYRFFTVDGASRYEIFVKPKQPTASQVSFMLYDTLFGENSKRKLDQAIAGLIDRDIKKEADGSFKIILDSSPANGRANHIQSNADARIVWVRESLDDWVRQNPVDLTIKRIAGPEVPAPATNEKLAQHAAEILAGGTRTLLTMMHWGFAASSEPNVLSKPFSRGGSWGYSSRGGFKLNDDEALLVTLRPFAAKYVGFQLVDPWLVSLESIHANGSLNNRQAKANKDDSITYVVSAKDPGVHNWLDTGGLQEGHMLIRWQTLPQNTEFDESAIREVRVVKLDELPGLLPEETVKVTAEQRKASYRQRTLDYVSRFSRR